MKPLELVARATLADSTLLELWLRDDHHFLLKDGMQISSSFSHGSDDTLAQLVAAPLKKANQPVILIDGLGLGFPLAAIAAEINKEKAQFIVAETSPDLIKWHHDYLQELSPGLWDDIRVKIELDDMLSLARKHENFFHGIILKSTHQRCMLSMAEASDLCSSMKGGGLLAISLSAEDKKLEKSLQKSGFEVTTTSVPSSHKGKKTSFHTIILARKGRFVPFAQR